MLPSLERLTLDRGTYAKGISGKKRPADGEASVDDDDCQVCLEKIGEDEGVYLECEHSKGVVHPFHKECLKRWSERSDPLRCPSCRDVVVREDTVYTHVQGMEWLSPRLSNVSIRNAVRWCMENDTTVHPMHGPVERWDVSSVTDMSKLFKRYTSFNADISEWVVVQVKNMSYMFEDAKSFDVDISGWDVRSVRHMHCMFKGAERFNSPLFELRGSYSIYDVSFMFENAVLFNQDLSSWDLSGVARMVGMFANARAFNSPLFAMPTNISSNRTMAMMFMGAVSFNQDLSRWIISSATTKMSEMFAGAEKFNSPLFRVFSEGTLGDRVDCDMSKMFMGASAFNQRVSHWEVENVVSMESMFEGATSFNAPLFQPNFSRLVNVDRMFKRAANFEFSDWDTYAWRLVMASNAVSRDQWLLGTKAPRSVVIRSART